MVNHQKYPKNVQHYLHTLMFSITLKWAERAKQAEWAKQAVQAEMTTHVRPFKCKQEIKLKRKINC